MARRKVRVNPTGAMILNGLMGEDVTITPPSGPWSIDTDYSFTAVTAAPDPEYDWQLDPGMTIVSGNGTDTVVVRFTSAGVRSVRVDVRDSDGHLRRAAWVDHVGADAPTYTPSLDFYDARNSMYAGCLN